MFTNRHAPVVLFGMPTEGSLNGRTARIMGAKNDEGECKHGHAHAMPCAPHVDTDPHPRVFGPCYRS